MTKRETISLIIPCYNEENNVKAMLEHCQEVFAQRQERFEYIFIDDGSKDKTYSALEELYHHNPTEAIKVIHFSRNFGKEAAMYAGLEHVSGDFAVIIDADLQQDPEYVLEMLDFLKTNPDYDMVACYQEQRQESKLLTSFKKAFYRLINILSETEFVANASDFRMMKREVVEAILQLKESHRFSKGIFSWVGFKTHYQPYQVKARHDGSSSWSFTKLFSYAIQGFVGFSTRPLKIATFLGSFISLISFIYTIYLVIAKLVWGNDVPGFTTIVCLILFTSGLQMILIGILGEYLSHTFLQVKQRPIYIIRRYLERSDSKQD